ncbi:MAG TPA: hypothetical protein VGI43_05040 [Mucilaginibacter sp.]|jgi:hypothetical protein
MKRQIIITLILLLATAFITVSYFKNISTPGMRTSQVMEAIPDNAALIFEFNNDKGFYDIFNENTLLAAIAGKDKIDEFDILRKQLLLNPLFEKYFTNQNIFISVHPSKTTNVDLLLTISSTNGFEPSLISELNKKPNSGFLATPIPKVGKQAYSIYINALKKTFYITVKSDNVISGSFSEEQILQSSSYDKSDEKPFILLSEQQNASSLANLYINYNQLSPLFDQLFENKSNDVFKSFRLLHALAALNLNYRSDALMFHGETNVEPHQPVTYLNLFSYQQPVVNHLKDIFPISTAYCINFSVSDPRKFEADLTQWYTKAGLKNQKDQLFKTIKYDTKVSLQKQFSELLDHEFALVTTRYFERFAIIAVNDGSKLKSLMTSISTMTNEDTGHLKYEKLPFFLLGDAFGGFRRPYFMILDNYLILANSTGELASYYDTYIKRKFLSKNHQYNQFDNLVADRSNVSFFFQFKNAQQILKRDMYPNIYDIISLDEPGWKNFYAVSFQFSAADKNFYTNFCIKLNNDTSVVKK